MARLGDICKIQSGGTPSRAESAYWDNGSIPWVKISDIKDKYLNNTEEYITECGLENSSAKIFPAGTILYTIFATLGEVCILNINASTNQAIAGIQVESDLVFKDYLYYYLLSQKDTVSKMGRGVAQNNINMKILREFELPLPPLEEQRRIAATLDKVSDLIAKRRTQLDKLDLLVKARFVEMFGDPVANPHGYPVHQLSDYIEFLTSGSRGWAQYFSDEGEYFITIKNVKNCRITLNDVQHIVPPDNAEAKRTKVQEGDLLISITADLGRTGVVTKKIADHGAYINQHLTCIRLNPKEVVSLYVAYYMESDAGKQQFQEKNQSAVKAGLNFNSINTLRLIVPPIEQQNSFIDFVERTDKLKLTIQKSLNKLETLKKSLMHHYFG
jgi:type I restriction enzyme S subunit